MISLSAVLLLTLNTQVLRSQEPVLDKAISKWEKPIAALEELAKTEVTSKESVLFFGSSSIRRWDTIKQDMSPWLTIQRGYGGAKLIDANHYAARILGPYIGAANPKRCKAIVIFVGNDISGNQEKDASPELVGQRFSRLLQYIRQSDPNLPVFWIEVTPTNKRWKSWPQIQAATRQVQTVLDRDPNAFLIPTAGAYLGEDGTPRSELFVDDELHLNETGYEIWSAILKCHLHQRLGAAIQQKLEPKVSKKRDIEN